jgi:hypothetical protein
LTVTYPLRLSLFLLSAGLIGIGCNRDETAIRTYSAPKDVPAPQVASADQTPADAQAPDLPEQSSPDAAVIRWTVPDSWKQVPGENKMRYASFQVSAQDPKAELTVLQLPAEAGALLPNMQRWAGQLKIAGPISNNDITKLATKTQISGEEAIVIDLTGGPASGNPPTRLLAAIVPHQDSTWFFTLKAPEPLAAAQKANFETFIHSIQFPTGPTASAAPSEEAAPSDHGLGPMDQRFKLAKWTTPAGWTEQPGSNAMRVTSFHLGSGAQQAEVIVSRIPQEGIGSFTDNINRWRGQVGLGPVASEKNAGFHPTSIGGQPGLLLDLTGPNAGDQPTKELLVALTIRGADGWFFKMLGPESVVSTQQDAFKQFLGSLQFEPESH